MTNEPLHVGDVCLDLTQGRPVQIIETTGQTVAEWSEQNNYDLTDNYGNSRLGTAPDDMVYECVYCSSAQSEPSKTYAMPASRLLRVEVEQADDGRRLYERIAQEVLVELFRGLDDIDASTATVFADLVAASNFSEAFVAEAQEIAQVDTVIGGDTDE